MRLMKLVGLLVMVALAVPMQTHLLPDLTEPAME